MAGMAAEKFYTSGTYSAPDLGIYGGWVALEQSFAAGQAFFNETKEIALLLSGECFLDAEDESKLRQRHNLGGQSGDWLVHLYEERGEAFFRELNGLFSGLLIDKQRSCAFLFTDRYGFDRVYLHETSDELYFASEAKALLRVLPQLRAFDPGGLTDYLTFGCTLDQRTLFKGVSLLPGGSLWRFQNASCKKQRYFNPQEWESQSPLSAPEFEDQFAETFKRILPRYFKSENPLGVSLTAGLDTRMVIACRPRSAELVSYTYDGPEGETLDTYLAAQVAASSGIHHEVLRLEDDFFSCFHDHADRTIHITDGCFGVIGAHETYFSAQARKLAPVRLTGVFGGEILREVSTFKPLNLSPNLLEATLGEGISATSSDVSGRNDHPVSFAAFQEIPWNIFGSLAACRSQLSFRTPYMDNDLVALAFRAAESLRVSSKLAIEMVKTSDPALGAIPTDMGLGGRGGAHGSLKRLIAKVAFKLDYLSNEGLPRSFTRFDPILDRLWARKVVFGHHKYLRYRSWFRKGLADYIVRSLADERIRQNPLWNRRFLERLARDHVSGRGNYVQEINAVLTLGGVERLLFSPAAQGPQAQPSAAIEV